MERNISFIKKQRPQNFADTDSVKTQDADILPNYTKKREIILAIKILFLQSSAFSSAAESDTSLS